MAEESEGSPLEQGACIAGTLLPFQGFWVLTGDLVVFSEHTAYLIERRFRRERDIEVSYQDILEVLSEPPMEEEESLDSLRERLAYILAEWDIANKLTVEHLEKRLRKTSPDKLPQAIGRILTDLGISSEDINQELINLLCKLHPLLQEEKEDGLLSKLHGLVKEKKKGIAPGPWEIILREDLYDYLQLKIHPDSYPDPKQLQQAIDKAEEECLNTPQEELADRTPREVIQEERIEWAEVLFEAFRDDDFLQHKADSFMAVGREEEGERIYQEILERNPGNFWHHVHAGDVFSIPYRKDPEQAREYYLQALEIARAQTSSNEALENLEVAYERLLDLAEGTGNKRWDAMTPVPAAQARSIRSAVEGNHSKGRGPVEAM